jgi:hypothetical protein
MDNVKSKLVFLLRNDPKSSGAAFFSVASSDPGEGTTTAKYVSAVDGRKSDLLWLTTTGYTQPSTLNLADAKDMIDEDKPAGDYKITPIR